MGIYILVLNYHKASGMERRRQIRDIEEVKSSRLGC